MNELIHQFGLDGRLLLAQVINFALLLFLLTKFLYRPLLKLLQEREQKIHSGIIRAQEYEKLVADVHRLRDDILREARREAQEIIAQSRKHAEEYRMQAVAHANGEIEKRMKELEQQLEEQRRLLHQKFEAELEVLFSTFLHRVFERHPDLDERFVKEVLQKTRVSAAEH